MWNSIPIKKPKKKKTKAKLNRAKRPTIRQFAKSLEINLPKSEVWFRELYKPFKDKYDEFNKPLHIRIPDVMNRRYMYILEIDGSIHETTRQRIIDFKKNSFYERLGFKVFRIQAYNLEQFN